MQILLSANEVEPLTRLVALNDELTDLRQQLAENAAGKRSPEDAADIAKFRDAYECDECEIDDDARFSISDEGMWAQAWVWLPHDEDEDEETEN